MAAGLARPYYSSLPTATVAREPGSPALRARHYSRRTERAFVAWARHHVFSQGKRDLIDSGAAELRQFPSSLASDGGVAASTQNQWLSAILFLYCHVLAVDLPWLDGVVRAGAGVYASRRNVLKRCVRIDNRHGL